MNRHFAVHRDRPYLASFSASLQQQLLRAGFHAHALRLRRDDGSAVEADLWIQDEPKVTDYQRAAFLLFADEPGSLTW